MHLHSNISAPIVTNNDKRSRSPSSLSLPSAPGHKYQRISIRSHAKAQLGDIYHLDPQNLLDRLPSASDAQFNSNAKQHEPTCLPNTRVELLRVIYNWINGKDTCCIFWLNGLAGTGKSTIARTVARKYFDQHQLGASFFFSKGGGDVSRAAKFVTSIAVQLACHKRLHQLICDAVIRHPNIAGQSLHDQWRELVVGPLLELDNNDLYILVVDALDECDNDTDIRNIIRLLAEPISLKTPRLRILLTSRSELPVRLEFRNVQKTRYTDFILHDISRSTIDSDISIFLKYYLEEIRQDHELSTDWPSQDDIKRLVHNASGLFIWAETACRFIREGKHYADQRLETILHNGSNVNTAPGRYLNELYTTVLLNSVSPQYTNQEKMDTYDMLRRILGSVVVLFSPFSAHSLGRLLSVETKTINQTLATLHAILDIPRDEESVLRIHHPSFRNFLLDKERCKNRNFWVDEKEVHRALAVACIQLMSTSLREDMLGISAPGAHVASVDNAQVRHYIPQELQYACLYWIQHLRGSGDPLRDNDRFHKFLQDHFLHWLESLSWIRGVSEGIYAMASLESIALGSDCPGLYMLIRDMKRFALSGRSGFEQAPLQVYCSTLVFAPTSSEVKKQFKHQTPGWIQRLPDVDRNWNSLMQTLEGHSEDVLCAAFSPNSKVLASASSDKTIRLWDAITGVALQTLKGHSDWVHDVVFSLDNEVLISASGDNTLKLWDAKTGLEQWTFKGHSNWVRAVNLSPNGKVLASASDDGTIKLWNTDTRDHLHTLKGHSNSVLAVAFSPDSKVLASASGDRTIKLWNLSTNTMLRTLEGHIDWVRAVTFSPSRDLLASSSDDKTIKLWDANKGIHQQTLHAHSDRVRAVVFSPDGKVLASASDDTTVKLWDISTGAILQTFQGHSGKVRAITFSSDSKVLASMSSDKTVKLWDASIQTIPDSIQGYRVCAITFSPDGKVLAAALDSGTIDLLNANDKSVLGKLEGHSGRVHALIFSSNGQLLASADDKTIRLWDANTRTLIETFELDTAVKTLAFSDDATFLRTDKGVLHTNISPLDKISPHQTIPPGLFIKDQWITLAMENLIWLPPEYRASCIAIYEDVVALGNLSGHLSILGFDVSKVPPV